jgi:molecular chaperone GrpE
MNSPFGSEEPDVVDESGELLDGASDWDPPASGEVVAEGAGTADAPDANGGTFAKGERSPLDAIQLERDEYLDALRRLQAEFDNYRKRTARQQSELVDRATESLLERLLPLLDTLDLAVAHAAPAEDAEPDGQTAVLIQIGTMMRDLLAKEGLDRIDEVGVEFDPTVHDAVAHVPADDTESVEHLIDDVLRPGYRLKGRVLRPAMVRVRG